MAVASRRGPWTSNLRLRIARPLWTFPQGSHWWGALVGTVLKSVLGKESCWAVGWPQAAVRLGRPTFSRSLPLPTPGPRIFFPAPSGSRQRLSPASRQGPRISSWKLNSYSMGLDTSVSRSVDRHSLFQESRARLPKQCLSLLGRGPGGGEGGGDSARWEHWLQFPHAHLAERTSSPGSLGLGRGTVCITLHHIRTPCSVSGSWGPLPETLLL